MTTEPGTVLSAVPDPVVPRTPGPSGWVASGPFVPQIVEEFWVMIGAVRVAFLPQPALQYSPDLRQWWPL